jgi:hypothetical protein
MNLIQDHQPIFQLGQVGGWIREFRAVRNPLEVEIDRVGLPGDFEGQGGLPDLTRPQQGNGRLTPQRGTDHRSDGSLNHPVRSSTPWKSYKVCQRSAETRGNAPPSP